MSGAQEDPELAAIEALAKQVPISVGAALDKALPVSRERLVAYQVAAAIYADLMRRFPPNRWPVLWKGVKR